MIDVKKLEYAKRIETLEKRVEMIKHRFCWDVANRNDKAFVTLYNDKEGCDGRKTTFEIICKLYMIKSRLNFGIRKPDIEYIERLELLLS